MKAQNSKKMQCKHEWESAGISGSPWWYGYFLALYCKKCGEIKKERLE